MRYLEITKLINKMIDNTRYIQKKEILSRIKI